eukprot:UN30018
MMIYMQTFAMLYQFNPLQTPFTEEMCLTMPPRPTNPEFLQLLAMGTEEFFTMQELPLLLNIWNMSQRGQGYGNYNIPLLYTLLWYNPVFIQSMPEYSYVKTGTSTVYKHIAEVEELNIEFNSKVLSVHENPNDSDYKYELTIETGEQKYADWVLFDCAFPTARTLLGKENPFEFFQIGVTAFSVHDMTGGHYADTFYSEYYAFGDGEGLIMLDPTYPPEGYYH